MTTKIDATRLDSLNATVELEIALCRAGLEWAKAAEKG